MRKTNRFLQWTLVALALIQFVAGTQAARAQDEDRDDPPGRAARLGHLEGSVSFEPAGENDWVEAVPNRPMTTGDKLWADKDSRAEISLGSATIFLGSNSGVSFLNLDDRTVQLQLSAGRINVRVRRLDRDDVFEIDTPNQAFTISGPGRYGLEASENGDYTVVTVREGEGQSTGNGQTYTVHQGQRATFSGTDSLNADVEQLGDPDNFDNWAYGRDRRYEDSRSARYCSHDMVGYEDLDEYGEWQPYPEYGNVWYPNVSPGWAPYHEGHWAWVDPWGWTWVDEDPWGYAPFHYGRWAFIGARWGWIPGPVAVAPVFAPALVVFVGGGGPAFGGNVAWFPLGPREVYVPSYRVSEGYVNRVNISNTTVNQTTITNVYNTTIVKNNTTINNVTYVNRNVSGAVTAVPQRAFTSAQPVARAAVAVNPQQLRAAQVSSRVAVAPTSNAVLGAHANTAGHVAAPPAAVASRPVIAKNTPPPPPPAFAQRQQALAAHPGEAIPRAQLERMTTPAARAQTQVHVAPPGKPATPHMGPPANAGGQANRPGNPPAAARPNAPSEPNRPGNPPAAARPNAPSEPNRPGNAPAANERPAPGQPNRPNQPEQGNRPFTPPARNDRPPAAQPNRPEQPSNRPEAQPNRPEQPNNRPEAQPPTRNDRPSSSQPGNRPEPNAPANRPAEQPPARNERPPAEQPNARPEPSRPAQPNRPAEPPARNERPPAEQPNTRPEPNRPPERNQPAPESRPEPPASTNRPANRPPEQPQRNEPAPRPQNPPPNERPQRTPPPDTRPQQQPQRSQPQQRQDRPPEKQKPDKEKPNDKQPPGM
ncbi:MAG TPA: DUF6600 domain-containing protein [Candidatus Sulfotelmatobacter sp.]|nr:DUF6600 domain-containing protein [Candidatus Sulfotelmatobacter sp.]